MRFVKESLIRASPEQVWAFHELPDALERLTPPEERVKIIKRAASLKVGERAIIETKIFGLIRVQWVAEHTVYDPPRVFEDVQISGPFKSWRHRHIISPHAEGAILRDEIDYEPPLSVLGKLFAPLVIVPKLERLFEFRHRVTREWADQRMRDEGGGMKCSVDKEIQL